MEPEKKGLRLLKKGKRGIVGIVFSRLGLIVLLLLIQIVAIFLLFYLFESVAPYAVGLSTVFSVVVSLVLINSRLDPTSKITWLVVFMILPIFGALLFLYTQSDVGHRALMNRADQLAKETKDLISQDPAVWDALQQESPETASLAAYLHRSGCYPVFDGTDVTYFPSGEAKFEELLNQLEQAKQFIYLEYFIVAEGLMWGRVLEILAEKAKEGLDIRVMYDGTCEFTTLPHNYPRQLKKLGISCKMFAPISPFISTHYNYRDHRKIVVIDGNVAFTGGINLADEYINRIERHGHWKDAAVMLCGRGVQSFTLMFLQMWNMDEKHPEFATCCRPSLPCADAVGYVIPYGDCPLDGDKVGERVYMDILNRAQRYVHIMTPYLILDGSMENALKFAAERGVDVTLILPGIPDKITPYALAKTHYASLLASGVKIREYTPGFIHSKVFVCDGIKAVVGTINLDYRSLYHHFECGTYLYGTPCIAAIEADFQSTLTRCREVTPETVKREKWYLKLLGVLVKALAPLM